MNYTVKQVSKMLNMTPHTIRYYTDQGLVPCLKRDNNGYRVFDAESLKWLKATQLLRKNGLTVEEISQYFELCQNSRVSLQERYKILLILQERTEKEYEDILARKQHIENRKEYFEKIIAGEMSDVCNPLYWDFVPDTDEDILG